MFGKLEVSKILTSLILQNEAWCCVYYASFDVMNSYSYTTKPLRLDLLIFTYSPDQYTRLNTPLLANDTNRLDHIEY